MVVQRLIIYNIDYISIYHMIGGKDLSKYNFGLDLDSENSISIMINMMKPKSKVLEFGPANGRMTRYLSEKMECKVDIIEIDEKAGLEASKYSDKSFIGPVLGDIENFKWLEELKADSYDYIIFADVLEHLHIPLEVLKRCNGILKDDGSIIMSVPNIAHNSIIIDLINDEFKYGDIGLLDNTHISFFAYKSLKRMIHEAGYRAMNERAVYSKVGENEIKNTYTSVTKDFAKALREREKGNVYQFVFEVKKKDYTIIESSLRTVNLDGNSEYEFVCYIKENIDDEYNEFKTIRKFIKPKHNVIKFEFTEFKEICGIRIDPVNSNCVIDIKNIYTIIDDKRVDLNIECTNGINVYDSIYIFKTNDPQIYLNVSRIKMNILYYECEFIDYDSDNINNYGEILKKLTNSKDNILEANGNIIIKQKNLINEKEQIISDIKRVIDEKEQIINDMKQVIDEKENHIKQIEMSRSWIYLKKLRRMIGR